MKHVNLCALRTVMTLVVSKTMGCVMHVMLDILVTDVLVLAIVTLITVQSLFVNVVWAVILVSTADNSVLPTATVTYALKKPDIAHPVV